VEIQSQIIKQEPVQWKSLKWLQSSKLKDLGDRGIEKLKNSLKENNFVQPFNVWQDSKGTIWILDGHHREKALSQLEAEGYKIPETLPANFISCKDKKDAAKMVLLYSSIYAKITNDGLGEFLDDFDLDLSNLVNEIDLPGLDLADVMLEKYDYVKNNEPNGNLVKKFGFAPFSVLDSTKKEWLNRKNEWDNLGINIGETREKTLSNISNISNINESVSVLDPVLCELSLDWFAPYAEGNKVYDCFAGDSEFGFVATYKGNEFTGIELRQEQVDVNESKINTIPEHKSKYHCDDGRNVLKYVSEQSQDLLFSCPPYFDLEVYSDLPNDASNQKNFKDFMLIIEEAFTNAIKCLKNNRFAVIIVGDIRDKKTGAYYNFIDEIKKIFNKNGLITYNELILVNSVGSLALRVSNYMQNRKIGKRHQNVLVFFKGDPRQIKKEFREIEIQIDEEALTDE